VKQPLHLKYGRYPPSFPPSLPPSFPSSLPPYQVTAGAPVPRGQRASRSQNVVTNVLGRAGESLRLVLLQDLRKGGREGGREGGRGVSECDREGCSRAGRRRLASRIAAGPEGEGEREGGREKRVSVKGCGGSGTKMPVIPSLLPSLPPSFPPSLLPSLPPYLAEVAGNDSLAIDPSFHGGQVGHLSREGGREGG